MSRMIAVDEDYLERLELKVIGMPGPLTPADYQLLDSIRYWQGVRRGSTPPQTVAVDPTAELGAEVLEQAAVDAGVDMRHCARCGSPLTESGRCEDITCPFYDHAQSCPMGWYGHPDHPGRLKCTCRGPINAAANE